MKVDVLLGLQWGDEGKGKIVDVLAPRYQVVARFQGGPNAGHTLEFDGIKHVLHQIPSGIFRSDIQNIIGNGVVLDPIVFKREIENLAKYNLDLISNLYVSKKASIIVPTHALLDAAYERSKGDSKIGSTLRGIGPAYQDKVAQSGLARRRCAFS
jgi:adenylosuccinate synthase